MKRNILKKVAAGVLMMAATGGLTGCVYSPQTSGTENASGAAVAEQSNRPEKAKGLKVDEKGKYSGDIDLEYQSSKYFYGVLYDEDGYCYICQISPDGKKEKKTEIKTKKFISLISVDDEWVYYGIGNKIYRVPIVSQNNSEILDKEQTECLVKKCSATGYALVSEQKMYYLTVRNVTVSKKLVKGEVQIHCLNLVTGKERVCPKKIADTMSYEDYKEDTSFDCAPSAYITENYIYYMDFRPNYLYQLNKDTLELTVIDELERIGSDTSYSTGMTADGTYLWYVKASAENRKCGYQLCRYDVKKQVKKEFCDGKECLDFICREENVDSKDVESLDIENIVHYDEDKIYIQYNLQLKEKKNVVEDKSGVMVYSMSADKLETLSELCKYFKKYSYEETYDTIYRGSAVDVVDFFVKENAFLLAIDAEIEEYDPWYAVYDMDTKKITKISDKKALQKQDENSTDYLLRQ